MTGVNRGSLLNLARIWHATSSSRSNLGGRLTSGRCASYLLWRSTDAAVVRRCASARMARLNRTPSVSAFPWFQTTSAR